MSLDDTPPTIGRRLKAIRSMTRQDRFAELIGVSTRTLSQYENDKSLPDAGAMAKIAERFKVSIDWLVTGHGRMRTDKFDAVPERGALRVGERLEPSSPPPEPPIGLEALREAVAVLRTLTAHHGVRLSVDDETMLLIALYRQARIWPEADQRRKNMEAVFEFLVLGRAHRGDASKEEPGA